MISVYSEKLICVAVKRQDNPPLTIVAEDRSGSKAKPNEIEIEVYPGKALEVAGDLAVGSAFTFRGAVLGKRIVAVRLGEVDL